MTACHSTASSRSEIVDLCRVIVLDERRLRRGIIDAHYAVLHGVRTRVYPGTGRGRHIADLTGQLTLVGNSIGLDAAPEVTVTNASGDWAVASVHEILPRKMWARLCPASRVRISNALNAAAEVNARGVA